MRLAVVAAVCLSAVGLSVADPATASINNKKNLNVPAQELRQALLSFSKASGLHVIFISEDVDARRTAGVVGEFTPDEALRRLLKGTGLTFSYLDDKTVTIMPVALTSESPPTSATTPSSGSAVGQHPSQGDGFWNNVLMAQVDQGQTQEKPPIERGEQSHEEKPILEEVIVTGSHIRGSEPIGSEMITLSRQDIETSGYGRIDELMQTVTQNFKGVSEEFSQSFTENLNFGTEIQLRGLGAGTTLTLIDGQRQPGGGTFGAFVDISTIPLSAVDHIDILPDGASAIYGSDAIGGVVNIVMRKDFQGAETGVRFGGASGGVAKETQLSQLLGTHWDGGHVMFAYQYSRRDPLPYGSRAYTSTSGDLTSFGGSDFRRPYGNPGTIFDPTTHQPAYAIPNGQDGKSLTVTQLIPGAVNYEDWSYVSILPKQEMNSAFLAGSQDLGDRVELFAEARYSKRDMNADYIGAAGKVSVPSTNPFYVNPFGGTGPVRVGYDFIKDLGPYLQVGTTEATTATTGVNVKMTDDWRLTVSGSWGKEIDTWNEYNVLNVANLGAALSDPNPATALNVFGDGSFTNPATLDSLRTSLSEQGVSHIWTADAIVDGPVVTLPAGAAKIALGLDYQDQKLDVVSTFSSIPPTEMTRHDSAVFAELAIPVVGEDWHIPGLRRIDISAAGRYDHYSDFGSTTNPKLGLNWIVAPGLKLRGTWGTSFRAPPFEYLNPAINPVGSTNSVLPDPKSPTGQTNVLEIYGANPNLQPEKATIWTAGLEFTPSSAWSASLTYFDIHYKDKIQTPDSSTLLAYDSEWAGTGVIVRNPTPAQVNAICTRPDFSGDCTAGPFGAIVDLRLRNVAVVQTSGLDINVKYSVTLGSNKLTVGVAGTHIIKYDQSAAAYLPGTDILDTVGNPISQRFRSIVSWSNRGFSANVAVNYAGAYKDPSYTPARSVSSWTTVDAGLGYKFEDDRRWLKDSRILLSGTNIFNRLPPFVNVYNTGYDGANANIVGATWAVQLFKQW